MTAVSFDPDVCALRAPAGLLAALAEHAGAPSRLQTEALERLALAGAARDGRLHPQLQLALRPVAAPVVELELQRGARVGRGWVDATHATFLVPLPDERAELRVVPAEFVPATLARLNDLTPRERYEPALRVLLTAAELAALVGPREAPAGRDVLTADALASIARGLREHWRVSARWAVGAGGRAERAVEVLDTDAGLWQVLADRDAVELFPTTPSTVYLLLCALLPGDDERGDDERGEP